MTKNTIFLLVISLVCFVETIQAQSSKLQSILDFRQELNDKYADKDATPLEKKDWKKFKGLEFFEPDTNYVVEAKLIRIEDGKRVKMRGDDKRHIYRVYAISVFELFGETDTLHIYQSERLKKMEVYKNHLFLPFTDLTSGDESYGGGRFIDLLIPEGDTIIIDFNKAYNPYCAYNARYSCPIPPRENHLDRKIEAGVKNYEGH